ncbi:hypothetical protein evm_012876 [Chilo suppressalis]|nr:hypothetical protein evm_012876 [Chilo suppressalis]
MELLYSMRRKPLKCEPPHFENALDTEVVRPIVTISVCNIIAFSSPTELSDADGDTWGGHVYVCDLDTPWDSHKVTSTVHPVSALEWDNEGKQLLVGTTAGDVSVYGQKEYLLNDWTCLYSASFPGEHIIRAIFFHNGRRVVAVDKKPDALITEKFQLLRSAPTLKGFGGSRSGGALVVSSSGLVGAIWGGDSSRALHAAEPLPPARLRVTTAALAHKSGGIVVAAGCGGSINGSNGGRWCVRCAVAKPRAPPHLALQPLPALYLPTAGDHPVTISWCLREDIDCLLVAGTTLTLWKLTEGAHPVHKLLSKGPLQGSTTPNGGPKTGSDCFNTVVLFYRGARWRRWLARSAAIVEVKQLSQWSVIGWVTKNLLSRAPPCFGRHVKPLVPAAFAVVSTHQSALGPRGGSWPNLPIPSIGKACPPAVGTLIG